MTSGAISSLNQNAVGNPSVSSDPSEDLLELIDQIETGDDQDRVLDAKIAVAIGAIVMRGSDERGYSFFATPKRPRDWAFLSNCSQGREAAFEALASCLSVPHYTTSVDAAFSALSRFRPDYFIANFGEWEHPALRAKGPWMAQLQHRQTPQIELLPAACQGASHPARAMMAAILRAQLFETPVAPSQTSTQ